MAEIEIEDTDFSIQVANTKWYQEEEKANQPIEYHDYLEEMHSNPKTEPDPTDPLHVDKALEYIRLHRWRAGYEVHIDDDGSLGPEHGIRRDGSGIGHIVKCDCHFIIVHWTTWCKRYKASKRFSRRDPRVKPLNYHVDNILANGKDACFKYEYDEEKIDASGNTICKVWFN